MAAAGGESSCSEEFTCNSVAVQFFEMTPLRRMQWRSSSLTVEDIGVAKQQELLALTVNSDLCREYPPSVQYQRSFVKKLLSVLEEYGAEICDEVYETYSRLLQQQDAEEDSLCYKTYTLSPNEKITVQESVNMISFGTTGLSTWQAAQHLAEWAIENAHLLENRNIVELGSGLGMLGLAVCQKCQIAQYTFSDCHTYVLKLLASNININMWTDQEDLEKVQTQSVKKARRSYEDDVHGEHSDNHSSHAYVQQQDMHLDHSEVCLEKNEVHLEHKTPGVNSEKSPGSSYPQKRTVEGSEQGNCENFLSEPLCSPVNERTHLDNDNKTASIDIGEQADYDGPLQLDRYTWKCVTEDLFIYKPRSKIRIGKLNWESMSKEFLSCCQNTSVLLAADVVYDVSIIPALVSVLKLFLTQECVQTGGRCVAYIASTVRNEDTRDQFLIALSTEGLLYAPVDPPTLKLFHYDVSVPIEIIKIMASDG